MTTRNNVGPGLAEKMSPEEVHDIKQEIHERFPNVKWPELSQERLYVAGYNFALPGVVGNAILYKATPDDENFEHAIDGKLPDVVGICSEQYNFIPYEVSTKKFVDFIDTYDSWGKPSYDFQIIEGGRKMKGLAKFVEHRHTLKKNAKVGDDISPLGGFYHGIDLNWMFRVYAGAERLVCSNGMVAHKLNLELGKKHKSTLNIDEMIGALAPTFERYEEQVGIWQIYGDTNIAPAEVEDVLGESGFGSKHQEEILALPEVSTGETLEDWLKGGKVNVLNLYNVLTQFTTHEIESELVRVKRGEDIAQTFETRYAKAA